ncbi:hypothetical protein [Ruania alba]|uniref:Uncharacterized protein n=1 Tax=Ruania alba TaxID=648782 RepID=A0A1H5N3G2_9MICO|nr:hypothetical protein [Ruania alba]SEE96159.1 hypothetical protein SAMN04488554_3905 [Ruania alba]
MTGIVWLFLAFVLIAAVALFVVIAVFSRGTTPRADHDGVRRVRNVILMARVAAAVLAVRVVMDVSGLGLHGQGLALAPVVVAIVWVLGGIAAEMVTRSALRDGGAALEVRSLRRYVPRRGTVLLGLSVALLVTAATITTLMADSGGRSLSYSCGTNCWADRSPWPGEFYTAPLAVAFVVLLALVTTNIWLAVSRPRGRLDDADAAADDATRTAAVAAALAVVALATAATAAGLAIFGLLPAAFDPDGLVLARLTLALTLAAVAVAAASSAALLVTAFSPRPSRTPSED